MMRGTREDNWTSHGRDPEIVLVDTLVESYDRRMMRLVTEFTNPNIVAWMRMAGVVMYLGGLHGQHSHGH